MAVSQILIRLLDGRTRCLQISSPNISGERLKQKLRETTNIPVCFQRLLSGTFEISDETVISAENGVFPSCNLLLRLRGGKGGFGSLLRGAATKAGQKKTNNFDACRDMSGRRLRHVNAEKKLEEWKAEEEERKLEKIAENFLKKQSKLAKKMPSENVSKYMEKYIEDTSKAREEVEAAVKESLDLHLNSKRKGILHEEKNPKRLKFWPNEEDESDESDTENTSVVVSGGSSSQSKSDNEQCHGNSCSDSTGSDNCINIAYHPIKELLDRESYGKEHTKSTVLDLQLPNCDQTGSESSKGYSDVVTAAGSMEPNFDIASEEVTDEQRSRELSEGNILINDGVMVPLSEVCQSLVSEETRKEDTIEKSTTVTNSEEPLDFGVFHISVDMEVLGMERLKSELQARGLKCGGTLKERAARLFLLKTTPIEVLPKKLFAKSK